MINKRIKTITALLKKPLLLTALLLSASSFAQDKPNILLLVSEDLSSRIASFGDPIAQTPNLDKLATTGVRYTNAFTTAGVCATSRTGLITGVHQITVGGQHMRSRDFKQSPYRALPPIDVKAFPEILRQQGYFTYVSNKLDYQFSNITMNTGPFTIWDDESNKPTWRHKNRRSDQPFFGMYHFNITHESKLMPKSFKSNLAISGYQKVFSPEQVEVPAYLPDTLKVRQSIASIYDHVYLMDKQIGQVLKALKEDGLTDNTIVIWTTDHGDALPRAKREIYDSGIKVPLIVHWPEKYRPKSLQPGSKKSQLISFVDLAPSILAMAGANIPTFIQGKPYLVDQTLNEREFIYASKDRIDEFYFKERAVRSKSFKYIKNFMPGKPGGIKLKYREQLPFMADIWAALESGELTKGQRFFYLNRPAEELYDLRVDPDELNNLAQQTNYQPKLTEMRQAYYTFSLRVPDQSSQEEKVQATSSWPNGIQPKTPNPVIVINNHTVTISNKLKGASLGYQINQKPWQVYSKPFQISKGDKVKAKSVRYGWHESDEIFSITAR
jgi:N-sulfoglucosamine sulfohydrolase